MARLASSMSPHWATITGSTAVWMRPSFTASVAVQTSRPASRHRHLRRHHRHRPLLHRRRRRHLLHRRRHLHRPRHLRRHRRLHPLHHHRRRRRLHHHRRRPLHRHHLRRRHHLHRRPRRRRHRFPTSRLPSSAARNLDGPSIQHMASAAAGTRVWAAASTARHGPKPRPVAVSTAPACALALSCLCSTEAAAATMPSTSGYGSSVSMLTLKSIASLLEATITVFTRATRLPRCILSSVARTR